MLVVIAIIGILAGILLPALQKVRGQAKVRQAKVEMNNLAAAIKQYEATYERFPASKATEQAAALVNGDVTYSYGAGPNMQELMQILLDIDLPTGVNVGHKRNPKQIRMLDAKQVTGSSSPGVSTTDWNYRDPWGNPYIVTIDLNGDGKCRDLFYGKSAVSGPGTSGLFGLTSATGAGDTYDLNNTVMVWSLGPNGLADAGVKANAGVNQDNVLGWQ